MHHHRTTVLLTLLLQLQRRVGTYSIAVSSSVGARPNIDRYFPLRSSQNWESFWPNKITRRRLTPRRATPRHCSAAAAATPAFAHFCHYILKVAFSQKRLENFLVAGINIPNHYPEQKI
jgi:hypothetical protein